MHWFLIARAYISNETAGDALGHIYEKMKDIPDLKLSENELRERSKEYARAWDEDSAIGNNTVLSRVISKYLFKPSNPSEEINSSDPFLTSFLFGYINETTKTISRFRDGEAGQKKTITSEEWGSRLWRICCERFSNAFYDLFRPQAEKLGFKFDKETDASFSEEIIAMNMWLITKALKHDKRAVNVLHRIYFSTGRISKGKEGSAVSKLSEEELKERYKKYSEAWKDNADGEPFPMDVQHLLAKTMLEYLFNYGKPDKKLENDDLLFALHFHIPAAIGQVQTLRKQFEISDY